MKPILSDIDSIVGCIRIHPKVIPDQTLFADDPLSPPTTFRLAVYPEDLQFGANNIYAAMDLSADSLFKISSGASPSTVELKAPYGAGGITRQILEMEYLRGALCYFFNTCWTNPVEDEQPLGAFLWGKTVLDENSFSAELTHMSDLLKQKIGLKATRLCNNVFADTRLDGLAYERFPGYCGKNPVDYTVNGTIISISGNTNFTDPDMIGSGDDWFGAGLLTFRNDETMHGIDQNIYEILAFDNTTGTFTLAEKPRCFDNITAGVTTYKAIAGCRKRRGADCRDKYSNAQRFLGFPDIPKPSQTYNIGR